LEVATKAHIFKNLKLIWGKKITFCVDRLIIDQELKSTQGCDSTTLHNEIYGRLLLNVQT